MEWNWSQYYQTQVPGSSRVFREFPDQSAFQEPMEWSASDVLRKQEILSAAGQRTDQSVTSRTPRRYTDVPNGQHPYRTTNVGLAGKRARTNQRGGKKNFCKLCNKAFRNLRLHQRTHTGEKPFPCIYCDRSFSTRSNLNSHLRCHTGEKPYHCGSCDKRFTRPNGLKLHQLTHTGEKPHQCRHCGKSFSQRNNLKSHQRTHTGEKPHQCGYCDKSFSQASNLRSHLRTHTGEKPYCCSFCQKTFGQLNGLKSHLRLHTGETPFSCRYCDKHFGLLNSLKSHLRHSDSELIRLNRDSTEFQGVAERFRRTMAGNPIRAIHKVRNEHLWKLFQNKKRQMMMKGGRNQQRHVDERKLFHGTARRNIDGISKCNFAYHKVGVTTNCFCLGKGMYFARDASMSSKYATRRQAGEARVMFQARVLVGEYTKGERDCDRPHNLPTGNGQRSRHFYDSCVDDVSDPQQFVVFDSRQVYPEYLIEFDQTSDYYRAAAPQWK